MSLFQLKLRSRGRQRCHGLLTIMKAVIKRRAPLVGGVLELLQGAVAPECGRDVSSSLWSKIVVLEAASEGADTRAHVICC